MSEHTGKTSKNDDDLDNIDEILFKITPEFSKIPKYIKERIEKTIDTLFNNNN